MAQDTAADIRMESDIFFLTLTLITGKELRSAYGGRKHGRFLSNLRIVKGMDVGVNFFIFFGRI